MSKKHFSWLAVITLVAAVAAFLVPSQTARDNGFEPAPLVPGLESLVNDVDWLRISAEGGIVFTAVRAEGRWAVEEAYGYSADWAKIHDLLFALAEARVIEAKTANPDYYSRLGVEDPGSQDATSVLVEFSPSSPLPAVIVGRSAQGREGQYVRLADSAQSVLIDRELDIPRAREDWLDQEIIDISESEVVELTVNHADGDVVKATKISADDEDFELQGVPENSEPKSSWAVNSLAGGLSALTLEAVVPEEEIDWSGSVHYRLVTADGLDLTAELIALPGEEEGAVRHWLRLRAGLFTTAVGGTEEQHEGATSARADAINERVSGWAYRVSKYAFDSMNKRMEDLVEPADSQQ